ncbi:MAG: restriction endonuclease subunit S [Moorea sp. SIO2B7]|nr:restriction endonuclease subunit S [Moorena sp. SIO2B7]
MKTKLTLLSNVTSIFNGKTPPKADQRLEGHPVLKIKDVSDDGLFKGVFQSFVEDVFVEKFKNKTIISGDTLILNAAHNSDYVGSKLYKADHEVEGALATGEWTIVRSDKTVLDSKYLHYWFLNEKTRHALRQIVKGIHLYPKDVGRLKIPLPPLEEQKRIAAILDKADSIRRKRKEAIALTEELLRSTFFDMFGDKHHYPMMSIGQLCKVKGGKRLPKGHQLVSSNTGYPYIRAGNLKQGTVTGELLYLTEETYHAIKRYTINAEDVYITIVGAYIGDVGIIPRYLSGANLTENAAKIVIKQNIVTNYFLSHFLRSDLGQRQIQSKIKTTGQPKFALFRIEEIQVPVPPIEVQIKFENIVKRIENIESIIKFNKNNLDNLFNSLLQKAFRGEL